MKKYCQLSEISSLKVVTFLVAYLKRYIPPFHDLRSDDEKFYSIGKRKHSAFQNFQPIDKRLSRSGDIAQNVPIKVFGVKTSKTTYFKDL